MKPTATFLKDNALTDYDTIVIIGFPKELKNEVKAKLSTAGFEIEDNLY